MDRRVVAAAVTVLVAGAGCAHAPADRAVLAPDRHPSALGNPLTVPARVFAIGDASTTTFSTVDADGTRRLIVGGMRLVEHVDGSIARAAELLPADQPVRTLELPRRLGGGYLFFTPSGGKSLIWRSREWTGQLLPLANLDFDVAQIVPGFDRLYVVARTSGDVVALNAHTGAPMDAGALPAAPAYGSLAFADEWIGAVDVPVRGVLATFDAGASWRPVGTRDTYGVALEDGRIVLFTSAGRFALDASGVLQQTDKGGANDALFRGAGLAPAATSWVEDEPEDASDPTLLPPGPLGKKPLVAAVLHGFPESPTTAIVADKGVLARVRVADGKILGVTEHALPADASCQGVRVGKSFGFVCGREHGTTVVYAFEPPLGLEAVLSFDEPRYVAPSANGALVVRGSCPGGSSRDAYCILGRDGRTREIRVKGDLGVERVVALSDGRTAVIVPPRLGAPGALLLIAADGATRSLPLVLPKADAPTLALVKKGLWLDNFVERRPGELAGWIVAGGPFIGVRLGVDGKVKVGRIQHDIEHTLLSDQLALSIGSSGVALESTNGGFEWREVDVSPDVGATTTFDRSGGVRGCSRVGCASSGWLRVGWSAASKDDQKLHFVKPPRATLRDPPAGGRWSFTCHPTGESGGRAALPVPPAPARRRAAPVYSGPTWGYAPPLASPDTIESTSWAPFRGVAAPRRSSDEVGFDTVSLGQMLHGYVWGARGANWSRVGSWVLYADDPHSINDGVWSTAVTRSPWEDVLTAAQEFGAAESGVPTNWRSVIDPSSHAGLLLVTARGTEDLFAFEEGRTISRIEDVATSGLGDLAGAVRLGQTWYVGAHQQSEQSFRVFRIEGNHLALFAEYPDRLELQPRTTVVLRLVRSARGDALGIWASAQKFRGAATSWFVFPIDLDSTRAGEPLELTPQAIANAHACGPGDDGWVLQGPPVVDPYLDLAGQADTVRATRPHARMLAGARGLCIDSLSAQLEGSSAAIAGTASSVASWAAGRPTISMTLAARPPDGRRWGFRCVH